jgi:hypothetical protein
MQNYDIFQYHKTETDYCQEERGGCGAAEKVVRNSLLTIRLS